MAELTKQGKWYWVDGLLLVYFKEGLHRDVSLYGAFCENIHTFLSPPINFALLSHLLIYNKVDHLLLLCFRRSERPLQTYPSGLFMIARISTDRGCQIYQWEGQEVYTVSWEECKSLYFQFKNWVLRSDMNEIQWVSRGEHTWRISLTSCYHFYMSVCTFPLRKRSIQIIAAKAPIMTLKPWVSHRMLLLGCIFDLNLVTNFY